MTACAFRFCGANVIMVVEQATKDNDEDTVQRYPLHEVGNADLSGPCPASLLLSPLSAYDREHLDERARIIEAAFAEANKVSKDAKPINPSTTATQPPHGRTPKPTEKPYWFNGSLGGPYAGKGIGATNDDIKLDFTPTPAPSPAPTPPTGVPMSDDSMRDRLRELTLLTCKALGEAQDLAAQITTAAEVVDGLMEQLKAKQSTAATLARLAVGSGEAPEHAKAMVDGAVVGIEKVDDADAALQALLVRIAAAATSDASAATSGISYLGTL